MTSIRTTLTEFEQGQLDKAGFIRAMYQRHHAALFDCASHLPHTNIKCVEISDGRR